MKKVMSLGLITAALILGMTSAQQGIRVGMAFDAGGKSDRSFNEAAFNGSQRAAKAFGADVKDFEPSDPSQVGQGIRNFASSGFDLVVGVGFANEPAISAAAKDFSDVKFAVVDAVPNEGKGANSVGLVFKEHEGSYLVGYIAGKTSSTGVVGFVGGMDIPLIRKFAGGYKDGVKAACPACTVIEQYVGTTPAAWNDPAKAKEIAASQAAKRADIIYTAAGASGLGVINYVNSTMCVSPDRAKGAMMMDGKKMMAGAMMSDRWAKIAKSADYSKKCAKGSVPMFFIGVDANQNYLGDTDKKPSTLNHGLTSMMKRVDVAVYEVIKAVNSNTFTGGFKVFGLDNGGVGYALDTYNNALISDSLRQQVAKATKDIISGKIKVTDVTAK
jgi:basic membrane protein A and related proteins